LRLAVVIISLAAIAVAMVHVRRGEITAMHEIQRLETDQVALRRRLWDQQVELGRVLSPEEIRRRIEEMAIDVHPHRTTPDVAGRQPPAPPRRN